MRARLCLLALFLVAAGPARATDWWWIGTSERAPERINTYIDSESAEGDGNGSVVVWVLTHRETPMESGELASRMLIGFDCQKANWALFSRISYASNGKVLDDSGAPDSEAQMLPIQPDSLGEALLGVACGTEAPVERSIEDPLGHSLAAFGGSNAYAGADDVAPTTGDVSSGTGFFVGPEGQMLTSFHVVDGAREIACRRPDGEIISAFVVRASPSNDIAVLQADVRPTHYLGLAPPDSLHHGDRVFTIGFPVADILGPEPRFTDGTVSALSVAGDDAFVQISVPIQPGNSGGPLVTETGDVVGIIAATAAIEPFYRGTGALPQNVNWAVKADYARPMLRAVARPTARTRQEAIERVRQSVCLVVAAR